MVEAKDLNTQSAELVMSDVQNMLQEQREYLSKASQIADENNYKSRYEDSEKTIASLQAALSEKDKLIREYQDLNQKLFLRTGGALGANTPNIPQDEPQTDPLVAQALEKIAAYNQSVKS